jgi:hypothetical protein
VLFPDGFEAAAGLGQFAVAMRVFWVAPVASPEERRLQHPSRALVRLVDDEQVVEKARPPQVAWPTDVALGGVRVGGLALLDREPLGPAARLLEIYSAVALGLARRDP